MRSWLGSVVLIVTGVFAVAAGCGNPEVVNNGNPLAPDSGVGGDNGTGATGGSFTLPDGGDTGMGTCPSTCDELGYNCGAADTDTKCGGVIDCHADCPAGQVCGGDGPNRCGNQGTGGDGSVCTPACATNQVCMAKACVTPTCPSLTTCAKLGYTCGPVGDGCGALLNCDPDPTVPFNCPIPGWTCGGGSDVTGKPIPGTCGCTGVCSQIPDCPTGKTTSLSGKVYDPAGRNPLYNVLVYVANDPSDPDLKTFPAGVTCDVCGASAAGSPIVTDLADPLKPKFGTFTGVDGSFRLDNVPVGKGITVVIQLGRWRRVFTVDIDTPCDANAVPDHTFLMPSTQAEGNIPLMAMVTGSADSLECVLRKMGIAQAEFTNPDKGGRVHFYLGDRQPGQSIDATTPAQAQLFTNGINDYDMTILACQGGEFDESANTTALRNYAAAGGRVFATHFSYAWLRHNDANTANLTDPTADNWSQVAKWHVDGVDQTNAGTPITGIIDKVSNPKANAFQGWLEAVGASVPGSGTTTVFVVRHDTDLISPVAGRTQQWLYRDGVDARVCNVQVGNNATHCTSNADCTNSLCSVSGATCNSTTPCTPSVCSVRTQQDCSAGTGTPCAAMVCRNQTQTACTTNANCTGNNGPCVANTCVATNTCRANACGGTNYTGQETPLHFTFNTPVNLVEDLTAKPPAVQCGRVLFSDFHVDDASENKNQFYPSQCALNVSRSPANATGTCTTDANCTGRCTAGQCPWGSACTANADCASTCSAGVCLDPMNAQEKLLEYMIFDLGSCVPTKTCEPATTCPAGQDCGYAPDNCGGLVKCGDCPDGEACGVGDPPVPNQCGKPVCPPSDPNCTPACVPKTCDAQGIECGPAGDYCGQLISSCGVCPSGNLCVMGKCAPVN